MNPKAKGEITQAIIMAELVKRGYVVLLPFGDNQRYDLVLDLPSGFKRIQCKTGRIKNGCVEFNTRSVQCNMTKTYIRDYIGQIEYFMVYCDKTEKVYVVSINKAARGMMSLRIDPPKKFMPSIKWAKEYELDSFQPV